ncbi:MAG: oligosaccharide flippase family protein [Deltaproteobacteria bacterium]|nr:oligosaccharide flippase family protein [Deltaproteobacteria bacterium]
MKHLFLRNAVFSILGRGWSVILGLIATPYIISTVGINGFGAWALTESIIAYFSLSDMGIGTSFTKHIAEYHAKKEYNNLSRVVSAGLLFYLILSILIFLLSLIFKNWILVRFDFSAVSMGDVSFIYLSMVAVMCIRMSSMPFWSVISGILRYDILNKTKMFSQAISFAGIFFFLYFGYGLKGLAVNAVIYAVIDIILSVIFAFLLLPQLKVSAGDNLKDTFSQLLKYGFTIQIVSIAEVINEQIDKIFLGVFRSIFFVGMYEIGAKIANVANSLAAVVLPILVPATSQLSAVGQDGEIRQLYIRGTRLIALVVAPVTTIVVFHAESLVRLWLGKQGFEPAAAAARFLTTGFAVYLIAGVGRLMSRGIGIPKYEMQSGILISIINVILSYFMIREWGLHGAVIASFISLTIGSTFFAARFNKQINVPNTRILKLFLLPALFSVISVLPTIWLPVPLDVEILRGMSIRMQSFIYLSAVTIITASAYLFFIFLSGFTEEYSELRILFWKKDK